jgi:hypothetical protein
MDERRVNNPEESEAPANETSNPVVPTNEEQDYVAAGKSTEEDFSQFIPPIGKQPKRHGKRALIFWIILLLLAAGGAVDWWLLKHPDTKKPAQAPTTQSKPKSATTSATKHYESTGFDLAFDYPENWTVTDSGDGKLKVSSPAMQLTDATGQAQNGQIVLNIQNKDSADLGAFKTGSAVAVLDSEKIDYTKPSTTQRKSTYISYLQYANTTTMGALDSIYVTGDFGYQRKQTIPETDILKVDPLIAVMFLKCADQKCSGKPTEMSVQSTTWNADANAKLVMNTLKSLEVK